MQIMNLSKKKFNELKKLPIDKSITNTEAIIYEFNYRNKRKIIKSLYKLNGSLFANKLYTLEMIDVNRDILPKSFVLPEKLISVNGVITGFTEEPIDGENLSLILNNNKIDLKQKIKYLKKIGDILEELKYIRENNKIDDLFINDLHTGNILIDKKTKELKIIDIDSMKICDNKPFPSKYLSQKALLNNTNKYNVFYKDNEVTKDDEKYYDYRKDLGYIIPDENSDLYCYIITILNTLYKDNINNISLNDFYEYLNYLESLKFNKKLIECFRKIIIYCDNVNPKNYLNGITYEMYAKANSQIFKKKINKIK